MSENRLLAVLACLSVSLFPFAVYSAPFCVEDQGVPAECWYYDMRTCKEEAEKRKAQCTANPQEVSFGDKSIPFCIVDAGMAPVCMFQSLESCQVEAGRRDAVCVENPGTEEGEDLAERRSLPEITAEDEPLDLFLPDDEKEDAEFSDHASYP